MCTITKFHSHCYTFYFIFTWITVCPMFSLRFVPPTGMRAGWGRQAFIFPAPSSVANTFGLGKRWVNEIFQNVRRSMFAYHPTYIPKLVETLKEEYKGSEIMMKDNILTQKNKKFKIRKHFIKEVMRILILSFNKHKKVLRVMLAVDCCWSWDIYPFSKMKSLVSCEIMIAARNPVVVANSTQRANTCRNQQTLQWNSSGDQMSVSDTLRVSSHLLSPMMLPSSPTQ